MTDAAAADEGEKKKAPRKFHVVIVQVPGWPLQDPGRKLVWDHHRPSARKSARAVKVMKERMPEYDWSFETLTQAEMRRMKVRPFSPEAYRRSLEEAQGAMDARARERQKRRPRRETSWERKARLAASS